MMMMMKMIFGWDVSSSQGYSPTVCFWYPFIHLGGERESVWSKVTRPIQGNNTTTALRLETTSSACRPLRHCAVIKTLLNEFEHENYQGRSFCYVPKLKIEADNTNRGFQWIIFATVQKPNSVIDL